MVRCLLNGGDVDYLTVTLAPDDAGAVRTVDVFELGSGGEWSRMLRTLALPLVVSGDADALARLSPADKEIINNAALLGEIYRKTNPSQLREVPSLIAQLPPSLQADRYLSILNVKATAQLSDSAFNAAVQRHQQRFPHDPSLSYATLQKRGHDKDYAKVLEALFTLETAVGDDPFIAALKAAAYASIGNVAMAKQNAREAVAKEPSLVPPHRLLVYVALEERDYPEVARLLTVLERELGEQIPNVKQDADFAGFVASLQYRTWATARGTKASQTPSKLVPGT